MKLTITKVEGAQRQLRTAIRLWFENADPVAILSLACSAHQVIHDLNSRQKRRDLLYDSLLIREEYRGHWERALKAPYNFLKHGGRDPNGRLELDTGGTDIFILFSVFGLILLGHKPDEMEGAYLDHFILTHPDWLTEKGTKFVAPVLRAWPGVASVSKSNFLQAYMAALSRVGDRHSIRLKPGPPSTIREEAGGAEVKR